ncbi:MAG: thioredoxin domain-containing protein [Bacteroidota bacterium]
MPNQLIDESSPYLQQHAQNPVDWHPWGEQALSKAQTENKPIFLSIGYATCHWCHVMEHESFEDQQVADLLNEHFVSIKVDREERPDLDDLYMTVCQMTSGQGGWPLNVFLTPDRRPFLATTYIPKQNRGRRLGMLQLLPRIANLWQEERQTLLDQAHKITTALQQSSETEAPEQLIDTEVVTDDLPSERILSAYQSSYDEQFGGFGSAPKFPSPHQLVYLLRLGDTKATQMATHTLKNMRRGGIWDHIGYGFHRYSTDKQWKLPHFEKMLYDQALLLEAYAEAAVRTEHPSFIQTATQIHEFVSRELMSEQGLFYSAQDADTDGEEGKFYTWTLDEINALLDPADAALVQELFNLEPEGNFLEEAQQRKTGRNVFYRTQDWETLSKQRSTSLEKIMGHWDKIRQKLLTLRNERPRPLLDDKTLTDWNALYINRLARAGLLLVLPDWVDQAVRSYARLKQTMINDKGELFHRYRDGSRAISAHADDYAHLIRAGLQLHQATGRLNYLSDAVMFQHQMNEQCWDPNGYGFFITAQRSDLLQRTKPWYDGAMPSVNSTAASNLLQLHKLTGESSYLEQFEQLASAVWPHVRKAPTAFGQFTQALHAYRSKSQELVVVFPDAPSEDKLRAELWKLHAAGSYQPSILVKTPNNSDLLTELASFTNTMEAKDGQPTYYLCEQFACQAPTTDKNSVLEQLSQLS